MKGFWAASCLLLLATADFVVRAGADELVVFGHDLSIIKAADSQSQLRIGSKLLHENDYVTIDEVGIVSGVPVVIGHSSPGGNACAGSPFVLSFPLGKAPRLDGPIETCRPASRQVEAGRIVFATPASASQEGETWQWTTAGFAKGGNVAFKPDRSKGWDDLRSREAGHPADLLLYAEVADQLYGLLGSDREYVVPILEGVGSAQYEGDYLIGESCLPHMCTVVEQVIVASLRDRKVFIAWKPQDKKIVVRPAVSEWPEEARQALVAWAQQWK